MLGIKKHVLELTNSLVALAEAIGLQKGPKAPKKRRKASKGSGRPPKSPLQEVDFLAQRVKIFKSIYIQEKCLLYHLPVCHKIKKLNNLGKFDWIGEIDVSKE